MSQMAVDSQEHVITHISAHHADKGDNQCLEEIVEPLQWRLQRYGLPMKNLLADTGYSSGENYAYLEQKGITSYIPPHGTFKGGPEGFKFVEEGNYWLCKNNKRVTFRKDTKEKSRTSYGKGYNRKKLYLTKPSDCKACPLKLQCIGKAPEKRITITYFVKEYQRAIERVQSSKGQYFKRKRSSTVEPVFGVLTQFMGLRKINTRGIEQANKVMLLSAMAYNLKKYLKRLSKPIKNKAQASGKTMRAHINLKKHQTRLIINLYATLKSNVELL